MRPLIAAVLITATALPASAETDKQRQARCAAQSGIVAQAIEMRKENTPEAEAQQAILDGMDEKLAPSVPILVGYVYSLESDAMQQDITGAFKQQCADFKQ